MTSGSCAPLVEIFASIQGDGWRSVYRGAALFVKRMSLRFLSLILCAIGSVVAQDESVASPVACRYCKSEGERACKKHGRFLESDRAVLQCSVAVACRTCAGALAVDCKICKNEVVERAAVERREQARIWLAGRRKAVDAIAKNSDLLHVKTAHLDLAFSIRPQLVGRRKLDTHQLMHLYADRIEALRSDFILSFKLRKDELPARLQVYMFGDRRDHRLVSPRVAGGGGGGSGMKLMGVDAVYCMYQEPLTMSGDEALHRNIVHSVAHLLISNLRPEVWLGNLGHGWIDAGVAHWFEDRITGGCSNYCYEEVGAKKGSYKGGHWRVPVRRAIESGKHESFVVVSKLNTDQLTWPQHALAFAYVDFLVASFSGRAFADFVSAIKRGDAVRDALVATFEMKILEFDDVFTAWVKKNYPLEGR